MRANCGCRSPANDAAVAAEPAIPTTSKPEALSRSSSELATRTSSSTIRSRAGLVSFGISPNTIEHLFGFQCASAYERRDCDPHTVNEILPNAALRWRYVAPPPAATALDRLAEIIDALAAPILDRTPNNPHLSRIAQDRCRFFGLIGVAVFEIGVDREVGCFGDDTAVLEELGAADRSLPIDTAQCVGHAKAGGR